MANAIGQRLDMTQAAKRAAEKRRQELLKQRGAPTGQVGKVTRQRPKPGEPGGKPGTGGIEWKPGMGMKINANVKPVRQRGVKPTVTKPGRPRTGPGRTGPSVPAVPVNPPITKPRGTRRNDRNPKPPRMGFRNGLPGTM